MPPGTQRPHEAPTRLYFELLVCQGDLDLDDVLELLAEARVPTTAARIKAAADLEGWGEEHAGGLPMEAPFVPVRVMAPEPGPGPREGPSGHRHHEGAGGGLPTQHEPVPVERDRPHVGADGQGAGHP